MNEVKGKRAARHADAPPSLSRLSDTWDMGFVGGICRPRVLFGTAAGGGGVLASLVCLLKDDQKAEMGVCAAVSWLYWPARAHGISPLSG